MKSVLTQIEESSLSKKGKTTTTGKFEGVPTNALVTTPSEAALASTQPQPAPIDVAANNTKTAPTYLDYLKQIKAI